MATTINELIKTVGLDPGKIKTVQWGNEVESSEAGVYIVSTSNYPDKNPKLNKEAPIDEKILSYWLQKIKTLKIGSKRPSVEELKERLSKFWLPDENILYIGQTTKQFLNKRISQFYKHELGDKRPHAGGCWIKTLNKTSRHIES
jgi:hypothetical protein